MQASEACIAAIKAFEGYREVAYQDSIGVWTVGYGWTLGIKQGSTMSEVLADALLRHRLDAIARDIASFVHVPLTQLQFDALCDFEYNLGRGALEHSTLLLLLTKGKYELAAQEFPRWCHAGDKVLPGLLKRRLMEESWFSAKPEAA